MRRLVGVGAGLLASVLMAQPAAAEPNHRTYAVPYAQAWTAVTRVAHAISGWYVVSASEESGFVTVRKGLAAFGLPKPRLLIKVEPAGPLTTRVTLTRSARGPFEFLHWWADGWEFRQFFKDLDELLPTQPEPSPDS